MDSGKLVFAQVMAPFPWPRLHHLVDPYGGHRKVQSFRCADPYRCMAFAQRTCRSGLRDIGGCLRVQSGKPCPMGIRASVARNPLANASNVRDGRFHASFAPHRTPEARGLYGNQRHGLDINRTAHAPRPAGEHAGMHPHHGRETP